jgi:N-acetylglucosaminyldiphosphoundecaprenol N-acetyl-beta-D-mannosaminyltransferase
MERKSIINFPITTGNYSSFVNHIVSLANQKESANVCVANVHMFIEAYKDETFKNIINEASIVTPDGKPLTWVLNYVYGIRQDRVAGMDLLPDLLQQMMLKQLPAFFYGGTPALLEKTEHYLRYAFPDLPIAGMYSPPFRPATPEEEEKLVKKINSSGAAVVLVILGCPKQEKWMASMKGKINAVMIGVGGALPVMVGMQKRAPAWLQNMGLEWLFRLMQEPRRLFRRYIITNSLFIYLFFKKIFINRALRRTAHTSH